MLQLVEAVKELRRLQNLYNQRPTQLLRHSLTMQERKVDTVIASWELTNKPVCKPKAAQSQFNWLAR